MEAKFYGAYCGLRCTNPDPLRQYAENETKLETTARQEGRTVLPGRVTCHGMVTLGNNDSACPARVLETHVKEPGVNIPSEDERTASGDRLNTLVSGFNYIQAKGRR